MLMKHKELMTIDFIPGDIQRIAMKIKITWTKLTGSEIDYYLEGRRSELLTVLQMKYSFSKEQAETALYNIERLT